MSDPTQPTGDIGDKPPAATDELDPDAGSRSASSLWPS